jgi:flagellar biosynthetic protein FliS
LALVNPYSAYARANVMTDEHDKGKILIKVLEALCEKIEGVKALIAQKKYDRKFEELSRMTVILEVLDTSLDMSAGEIPRNLSSLYGYLIKRLREVHQTLDSNTLDECKTILMKLLEGFTEAYHTEKEARVKQQPESTERHVLGESSV